MGLWNSRYLDRSGVFTAKGLRNNNGVIYCGRDMTLSWHEKAPLGSRKWPTCSLGSSCFQVKRRESRSGVTEWLAIPATGTPHEDR